MRRCRKLISMIVMMAMLATMTPYQVLAADTTAGGSTDTAVETTPTVVDEQEEGTEKEEDQKVDEDQNDNEDLKDDEGLKVDESQKADEEPKADVDEEDKEDLSIGESGSETGDEEASNAAAVAEEISDNKPAEPAVAAGNAESTVPAEEEKKEVKLSEGTISKEAGGYTVKAEGMLPEGAELVLTRLSDETLAEVAEGLEKEDQTAVFAYDVTIKDAEGKIWQPEELGVKITIKGLDLKDKAEVSVAHVLDKEEAVQKAVSSSAVTSEEVSLSSGAAQELKTAVEAAGNDGSVVVTTITKEDGLNVDTDELSFDVDSFSTFIVFTVDFEYEDFAYSIKGESSILLSELFAALNIEQDMTAVTSVEWEEREEYDPNELVSIEAQGGDWKFTSLKAFDTEETLIVAAEGGKIYRIKVTDAPEDTEYTYQVDYPQAPVAAYAGKSYAWLDPSVVKFYIKDAEGNYVNDNDIRDQYTLKINSVTSSDPAFVWDGNPSYVLSDRDGVTYTVTFGLYKKGNAEEGTEDTQVTEDFTITVKTYNSSSVKDYMEEDDQYITSASVVPAFYNTGTGPFDSDNEPGNDSSPSNNVLRSFDSVHYELNVTSDSYSQSTYYKDGYVGYLILLAYADGTPIAKKDAKFKDETFSWMESGNSTAELNRVINGTGTFTVNGTTARYTYVKGYKHLSALNEEGATVFPIAGSTCNFDIRVGGLPNGEKIKPLMWTWIYHNDVNVTSQNLCTDYNDEGYPAHEQHKDAPNGGKELVPVSGVEEIIISAAPQYNVQLKEAADDQSLLAHFDFTTGNSLAQNKDAGSNVLGRMYGFGLTLQLYNADSSKGLKGIEIPAGPITFDINLEGQFTSKGEDGNNHTYTLDYNGTEKGYTPLLWSSNVIDGSPNRADGRNIQKYYPHSYPRYAGPATKLKSWPNMECYNGGNWSVVQDGSKLRFTVNNYQIDSIQFPNGDYPEGGVDRLQIYWKSKNGIDSCAIGCFSSYDFWVVVPTEDKDGVSLLNHTTTDENGNPISYCGVDGRGQYKITIRDVNMSATSISNQTVTDPSETNSAQVNKKDDNFTAVVPLEQGGGAGTYSPYITYNAFDRGDSYYDAAGAGPATGGFYCHQNGLDRLEIGQKVGIAWGLNFNPHKNENASVYAINALMKFDDEALEVDESKSCTIVTPVNVSAKRTYLFAAKPDGTGWNSDQEMINTVEEQLLYYPSLTAMREALGDDAICVGVLAESRFNTTYMFDTLYYDTYKAFFNIKEDTSLWKNVYQTVHSTTYWTYGKYVQNGKTPIPSRLDVQNSQGTAEEITMPAASRKDWREPGYKKTTYTEDGKLDKDHIPVNTVAWGDSLYIIPYRPMVGKYLMQKTGNGSTKTEYNLDLNQDTVDFSIDATVESLMENFSDQGSTTTVILTDTIPKGLTYNDDAVLNGTYSSGSDGAPGTVTGGAANGGTLNYTTADGKEVPLEFYVTSKKNSAGATIVTFTIVGFPIGETIPINYSVTVDSGAKNNQSFTNSVNIKTKDLEPYPTTSSVYRTQAITAFTVTRSSSLSLSKQTEKTFVDVSAKIGYNMVWQNTGVNPYSDYPMFDILPYDGCGNCHFSGTYELESINLTYNNGKTADFSDLEVWYTNDESVRSTDLNARSQIHDAAIRASWTQADVDPATGAITAKEGNSYKDATAFCILGTLKATESVKATCVINPSDNEPGDKYENTISIVSTAANARGIVLNRLVDGCVWYDVNRDGVRQSSEKKMAGVKVMLVNKADYDDAVENGSDVSTLTPVKNLKEENCVLESTGADGSYEFGYLPAGDFVVLFLSTDKTDLGNFTMTGQKVPEAIEVNNSDASEVTDSDDKLVYGYIPVSMPKAEDITSSPYRDDYEDMGLLATADITANKVWDNADGINTVPDGAEVTFTLTGNGLSLETTLDGTADDELETDSATQASYGESEDWKAAFNDLPRYTIDADGYAVEAEYKVEETEGWENYEVRYSDNASKLKNGDNATITNKIKNGDLEISKTVVSPVPAESSQTFDFTIVLDPAVTMTYNTVTKDSKGTETKGTVSFTEGKQTVTVAGGSTLTILELPAGMDYTVTEVAAEGSVFDLTDSSGAEGKIEADKTMTAAFTNTRKTGSLEVTKEVVNKNDTNTAKEFTFTVTLDDDTINGEFGDEGTSMTFEKGVATFTLKDGETKTATGLPSGTGYTVVETAEDGFVTRYEGTTGEDGSGDAEGQAGGTEGQTDGDETDDPEGEPAEETDGISGTIVEKETETVKVINTYMTEGEYAVEVKKVLEGRLLREGQFEFELSDSEGVLQTVKNGADGTVKFDPIVFTEEDLEKETEGEKKGYFKEKTEKTYTVKEVIPEGAKDNGDGTFTLDGYTYDAKEQAVTVSLKDNGDGTITAEADKKIEDLIFTNIYAADGEVFIGGTKVLEGQDLKEGQFKFVLSDESGKKVLEATNDANGNFEFEVIRFELSDLGGEKEKVFSYGVAEINDGQSNITYDKTAYTVKVTVTDNGDGTLTAKADKSRGEIRFTNKYTPPETPKEDKPKHKKSNNTGDSANGALWALMLLLAGGALAGTVWFRRRKKI